MPQLCYRKYDSSVRSLIMYFLYFYKCEALQTIPYLSSFEKVNITILRFGNGADIPRLTGDKYSENTNNISIQFESYGIYFNLLLFEKHHDRKTIVKIYSKGKYEEFFLGQPEIGNGGIYEGKVENDLLSSVLGYLHGDEFTGFIRTNNKTYFIEPLLDFLQNDDVSTIIVYRPEDILFPKCENETSEDSECILRKESIIAPVSQQYLLDMQNPKHKMEKLIDQDLLKNQIKPDKACNIKVVSDYRFFQYMGNNRKRSLSALLFYLKSSDCIYRRTDFNSDGSADNVRIIASEIVILESEISLDYPEVSNNERDPKKYLQQLSLIPNDKCLTLYITSRTFYGRVVGLAFRASPGPFSYPGGICQEPYISFESIQYTNIAAVSTKSTRGYLPFAAIYLTIVHEIGHSFGSLHDDRRNLICSPGGSEGTYIMSDRVIFGTKPNNYRFSPCSISIMWQVIKNKGSCLGTSRVPVCGDGFREGNEECDCGAPSSCNDLDPCCTPKGDIGNDKECTYRRNKGAVCSHHEDSCCTKVYEVQSAGQPCLHHHEECTVTTCDGNSSSCPKGNPREDGTPCQGTSRTCKSGACSSTVCLDNNLKNCWCSPGSTVECQICCETKKGICRSASDLGFFGPNDSKYFRQNGALCDLDGGRCNSEGKCVQRDEVNTVYVQPDSRNSVWLILLGIFFGFILCVSLGIYLQKESQQSLDAHPPEG